MHLHMTSFNGNPNVGLYIVVTDKVVLVGKDVPKHQDALIEEALGLPVRRMTLVGTGLLGVFALWTGSKLLVPHIIFDHEAVALEQAGLVIERFSTRLTALGNNILLGPKSALLNPEFSQSEQERLTAILQVPCERTPIMEIEAIGALGACRKGLMLLHRDVPPQTVKALEQQLGVKITLGTVNMGNPYIKSGLVVSEKGLVIGSASGGPEVQNADEALGFI